MTPSPRHPAPPLSARRGGFVFILVLVVMLIGAAMVTWSVQRSTTEGLIAQRQADAYARHHLLLGIRDVVHFWLVREAGDNKLDGFARDPEFVARQVLPDRSVVQIRVRDGQGTVRARLDPGDPVEVRDRLLNVLRLLPPDRPDLIRRHGPPQVSITAAPPEVINAVAGGNPDIVQALTRLRDRQAADRANIFQELMAAGYTNEEVQAVADMVQLDGNRLYEIEATVIMDRETVRFVGFAQIERSAVMELLDWREVPIQPDGAPSERPEADPTDRQSTLPRR